jgi:hypothetical protein
MSNNAGFLIDEFDPGTNGFRGPVVMGPVTDLVCVDDVDLFARETTSALQALVQDVYHMLIEAPGSNLDVPGRGIGIYNLLSAPSANQKQMANLIDQQLPLDARIDACTTTIVSDAELGTIAFLLKVQVDGSVLTIPVTYSPDLGLVLGQWGIQ